MAACHIPYVFTATEAFPDELVKKGAKAQYYAKHYGMVYGKMLITCPLNWRIEERRGVEVLQAAVNCCFFPLYEIERGITKLTHDPELLHERVPVRDWLSLMGKTKHLLDPQFAPQLEAAESEIERRWRRIKAMSEHPAL
jgi:pyruvate ferredoxin oxidoreductase alpha subunit